MAVNDGGKCLIMVKDMAISGYSSRLELVRLDR